LDICFTFAQTFILVKINNKKQFERLLSGVNNQKIFLKPILKNFAACFNETTSGKFASDY
jgi:hypothetical protein